MRQFGPFQLDEKLYQAALFTAFKAIDTRLNRSVGLLICVPEIMDAPERRPGVQQFFNLTRTLAKLQNPNVIEIYECAQFDNQVTIAYELIPSELTLDNFVPRPPAQVLRWLMTLAGLLEILNKEGIYHCNLAPRHLGLVHGALKLSGFSVRVISGQPDYDLVVASSFSSEVAPSHALSDEFSPPELLLDSAQQTAAGEVFSLAALGYFLLTGRRGDFSDSRCLAASLESARDTSAITEPLEQFLARCLAVEAEERIQSLSQFIEHGRLVSARLAQPEIIEVKRLSLTFAVAFVSLSLLIVLSLATYWNYNDCKRLNALIENKEQINKILQAELVAIETLKPNAIELWRMKFQRFNRDLTRLSVSNQQLTLDFSEILGGVSSKSFSDAWEKTKQSDRKQVISNMIRLLRMPRRYPWLLSSNSRQIIAKLSTDNGFLQIDQLLKTECQWVSLFSNYRFSKPTHNKKLNKLRTSLNPRSSDEQLILLEMLVAVDLTSSEFDSDTAGAEVIDRFVELSRNCIQLARTQSPIEVERCLFVMSRGLIQLEVTLSDVDRDTLKSRLRSVFMKEEFDREQLIQRAWLTACLGINPIERVKAWLTLFQSDPRQPLILQQFLRHSLQLSDVVCSLDSEDIRQLHGRLWCELEDHLAFTLSTSDRPTVLNIASLIVLHAYISRQPGLQKLVLSILAFRKLNPELSAEDKQLLDMLVYIGAVRKAQDKYLQARNYHGLYQFNSELRAKTIKVIGEPKSVPTKQLQIILFRVNGLDSLVGDSKYDNSSRDELCSRFYVHPKTFRLLELRAYASYLHTRPNSPILQATKIRVKNEALIALGSIYVAHGFKDMGLGAQQDRLYIEILEFLDAK